MFFVPVAGAVDVTGSASFTVILESGCAISNSPVLSVNYIGLADASSSSDKFSLQSICNNSVSYTITVGAGNNASGGIRRAAYGGSYVNYRLYTDSGRTQELGASSSNTITGTGDELTQTQDIYASVLVSDNSGVSTLGAYTDVITVVYAW